MADGVIKIDTRLDNSKIPSDLAELKDLVNNANLGEEAKQSAEELLNTFAKLEVQQAKNNQRVSELKGQLEELTWIAQTFQETGDTRLYEQTRAEVDATQLKLREAEQNTRNIDVAMSKVAVNARTMRDSVSSTASSSAVLDLNYRSIGKSVLRYGMALFSIRSIYLGLTRSIQAWMRATEEGAQAQSDLAYIWQSIGTAVAPIFLYLVNLMKTMLGYVNAITKALFGFQIFTKEGAKNMNSMAKGAKDTKKQLAGFDEMNVLSGDGGASGGGVSSPVAMGFETPDISGFTTWMERLAPIVESLKVGFGQLYKDYLEPMFASIGGFMVGVGQSFITGLETIFEWASNNGPVIEGLAYAVGILTVAFIAMKAIMLIIGALAGMSPLGWIILGIGLIITAIGFWKNNQEAIMKFIDDSMKVIVSVFKWAFDLIVAIIQAPRDVVFWLLGVIGKAFKDAFTGIWNNIKDVFNNIKGIFNGIITFITGIFTGNWKKAWEGVLQIFDNIFKGLFNIFKAPLNFIIDGINSFIRSLNKIKIPDWVPVVGGKSMNLPTFPRLARGGIVTSATQAIIGEAGREAVIPLQNNTGWVNEFLDVLQSRGGFGGSGSITIINEIDGKEVARRTIDIQKEQEFRTNGGVSYGY